MLGLLGARTQWRADRRAALAMTTLLVTLTVVLVFYLNFKWGYSQPYAAQGIDHEVRERDYFFIASFAAWGVWVGIGLAAVMAWIEERLARRMPAARTSWAWSAPALPVALLPLFGSRLPASRAGETSGGDYGPYVMQASAAYALVVTA